MLKAYIKTAISCEHCASKIIETIQPIKGLDSVAIDMQSSEIALTPVEEYSEAVAFNAILYEVQNRLGVIDKVIQGIRYDSN